VTEMTRHQRLEAAPHWTRRSISQNVIDEAVDQWKKPVTCMREDEKTSLWISAKL